MSKALTIEEVRAYRDRLYKSNPEFKPLLFVPERGNTTRPETEFEQVRQRFSDSLDYLSKPWRYSFWLTANTPELFAFKAANRADGICLIEQINLPDGRTVIACIQIAGTPGNSITNAVEELCFQVCERFEIPSASLVWLEHYDEYEPLKWHRVTFERTPPSHPFENPAWTEMTESMWRELKLRPRKKLMIKWGQYHSKLAKLFPWPTEAIL